MLANKPLSPHILPVSHASAIVETHRMALDHSLSIEAPAPFKNERTLVTKSPNGRDSVSSNATESYPEDNPIEAPPCNRINSFDHPHESVVPLEPPVLIAQEISQAAGSMDDINERELQELMEGAEEDFILGSSFSDDLSDGVEMDLDKVAHVPVEFSNNDINFFISPTPREGLDSSELLQSYNIRSLSVKCMLFPNGGMTEFNPPKPAASKSSKTSKPNPDQTASDSKKPLAKPRRDSESTERPRFGTNNSKPPSRDAQPNDTYAKSSRSSISESKQKQPKSKHSNLKKQRDRDDFNRPNRSGKNPATPEGQNFDDLLESTIRSQTDPENGMARRGSEAKERKPANSSRNPLYNSATNSQSSSSTPHTSSLVRRIPDRDSRSQDHRSSAPIEARRAGRTEGRYSEATIRSPPRSSSRPSGQRGISKSLLPSEGFRSFEGQKD